MHYPSHLRERFCQWVSEGMPETATVEIDYEVMEEPDRECTLRFIGCTDLMPRMEMEHAADLLDVEDGDFEGYAIEWDGTYQGVAYRALRYRLGMEDDEIKVLRMTTIPTVSGPNLPPEAIAHLDMWIQVGPGHFKRLRKCTREDLAAAQSVMRGLEDAEGMNSDGLPPSAGQEPTKFRVRRQKATPTKGPTRFRVARRDEDLGSAS